MDTYGRLINRVVYPLWERRVRRRPTLDQLDELLRTQWASLDELHDLQAGHLARLVRHAYEHTAHYRQVFDAAGLRPDDIRRPDDLARLPVLDREVAQISAEARLANAPPLPVVRKTTSGTMGRPLAFAYNAASQTWREAMRQRGYAWAGYQVGAVTLHYWGLGTGGPPPWRQRAKIALDRAIKRERYVDCTPRGDAHLAQVVATLRELRPAVIVTYSHAGAALARYVLRQGARDWSDIAVICGAERLLDADRDALVRAFGPGVFETYGCREFMLIGTECEAHDGLHTSMENLVVEVVVREPGGTTRPAAPGESGEVVVTDLHNLAQPFIRYANGDRAVARAPERCGCGRWLSRIGPIEGRVTETLRDAEGNAVSGMLFNILFCDLAETTRQFQAVQHRDGSITLKVVPTAAFSDATMGRVRDHCQKYLPGVAVRTELVDDIPVTAAGKRRVVVVEPPA